MLCVCPFVWYQLYLFLETFFLVFPRKQKAAKVSVYANTGNDILKGFKYRKGIGLDK